MHILIIKYNKYTIFMSQWEQPFNHKAIIVKYNKIVPIFNNLNYNKLIYNNKL